MAKTIGKGMIDLSVVTQEVILAGLLGAIFWNLFTWYYGLPVSSSHALIGGYAGAAVAKAGFGAILLGGLDEDAALHRARADHRRCSLGFLLMVVGDLDLPALAPLQARPALPPAAARLGRPLQPRPRRQRRPEDDGHHHRPAGGLAATSQTFEVPLWVILISHAAIALGTMFGGWRIVKTMGTKITKLQPFGGFCAETAGAITLFGATLGGIPVSTTHTITGAIIGVGATRRISAVKWGVAGPHRLGLGPDHPDLGRGLRGQLLAGRAASLIPSDPGSS